MATLTDEELSRTRAEADMVKVNLENTKLKIETDNLAKNQRIDSLLRLIPFLTVLGFCFTIYQYTSEQEKNRLAQTKQSDKEADERLEQSRKNLEQRRKDRDTAQKEFMKPLLTKQSELYFEASSAAATIATTTNHDERIKAVSTFWRLYHSPLIFVENEAVSGAMKKYGHCLDGTDTCDTKDLQMLSRHLASPMEESILATYRLTPETFANGQFKYPETPEKSVQPTK